MIKPTRQCVLLALALLAPAALAGQQASFTIDQAMSPPFPDELVAAPGRSGAVAWVFNARGARNIWVAAPPDYRGKAVTTHTDDDGQELADLRWTPDARAIVYVRGGGPNQKGEYPNPHSLVTGVDQAVWVVAASGGAPRRVGEGHSPAVSPTGDRVAFLRHGQVWWASPAVRATRCGPPTPAGAACSARSSPRTRSNGVPASGSCFPGRRTDGRTCIRFPRTAVGPRCSHQARSRSSTSPRARTARRSSTAPIRTTSSGVTSGAWRSREARRRR